MSRVDTVLFDFDGTLMDTNEVIMQSWQYTFRTLTGKEGNRDEIIRTYGEPLAVTMKNFFGGTDEQLQSYVDIYRGYQHRHFRDDIEIFPGVQEMLRSLKAAGYKVALVTSRLKYTTMQGIEKFELGEFFDAIVTAEDTDRHKPDPTPVNTALAALDVTPDRAVMVGDTWLDIVCAKNAGVIPVLVGWSAAFPEEEAAKAEGEKAPAYIIHTAAEMSALLEKINSTAE